MENSFLHIEQSLQLNGEVALVGAKNAVLVIIASMLLTSGKSRLTNVPASSDVLQMIKLIEQLGAIVFFDQEAHVLEIDTAPVNKWCVSSEIMKKMRASILVMGPLLARFGRADIALPGGCSIGERPVDYHLKNFVKMGVFIEENGEYLYARSDAILPKKLVLEYPSVGATENLMMAATLTRGTTQIINAAIEPEVLDLIMVLKKMGAKISVLAPATIEIEGVEDLLPVEHDIIPDRLEAGALLLAAAITGGEVSISSAPVWTLDVFLAKLEQMGHMIEIGANGFGIRLRATKTPKAVSFKTGPFPGFPTDLQAPMMAAQCLAEGTSVIEETVFENRFLHVRELQKMGALITVEYNKATIKGVDSLYGASVIATDIRGSCAMVLAALAAKGTTTMSAIHHWRRGYESLDKKLAQLGAHISERQFAEGHVHDPIKILEQEFGVQK